MKKILVLLIFIWLNQIAFNQSSDKYDLVIYGGTSAGVSAAIQASRMGKSVFFGFGRTVDTKPLLTGIHNFEIKFISQKKLKKKYEKK